MIQLTKIKFILALAVASLLGGITTQVIFLIQSSDKDRPACVSLLGNGFMKSGEVKGTGAEKSYGPSSDSEEVK